MPGTSTAKAKEKVVFYVADAIIEITDGRPDKAEVYIKPNGTVQFINKDEKSWRIRLFTREHSHHADVDLFCPVRSAVTVLGPANGECRYEVLDSTTIATGAPESGSGSANGKRNGGGSIALSGSGQKSSSGGGTIKIGPMPK